MRLTPWAWFRAWLAEASSRTASPDLLRLAIDVSSLSRKRIASSANRPVHPSPWTARRCRPALHARELPRPVEQPDLTEVHGPVTNWYAGWSGGQSPVVAFIGIGYEEDRALGVFEYLEPGDAWAFIPEGEDAKYDVQLRTRNGLLFDEIRPERRVGPTASTTLSRACLTSSRAWWSMSSRNTGARCSCLSDRRSSRFVPCLWRFATPRGPQCGGSVPGPMRGHSVATATASWWVSLRGSQPARRLAASSSVTASRTRRTPPGAPRISAGDRQASCPCGRVRK